MNIVDRIRRILADALEKYYKNIPPYIAIDHFWHWLETVGTSSNSSMDKPNDEKLISLFYDFYLWDKDKKYTQEMYFKAKNIFNKYLSKDNIENLGVDEIKEIYRNLHAEAKNDQRFHTADKFLEANSLEKIKRAFNHLLYSNDDVVERIDSLINPKSDLKLKYFNSSCTQELLGWVFYDKYPMRNEKADSAVNFLGYSFDAV